MTSLQQFPIPSTVDGRCGYCGYNPKENFKGHLCDGFGHSVDTETGQVYGDGCRNCIQGYFCEKAWHLEHPGEPIPEPESEHTHHDNTPISE